MKPIRGHKGVATVMRTTHGDIIFQAAADSILNSFLAEHFPEATIKQSRMKETALVSSAMLRKRGIEIEIAAFAVPAEEVSE